MKKAGFILSLMVVSSLLLGAATQRPRTPQRAGAEEGSSPDGQDRQLVSAAEALEKDGDTAGALADYTKAIEDGGLSRQEEARAFFGRGLLLDELNRPGDALGDYGAALSRAPRFAAALNNRANVYRRLRRYADAERDYRASLAAGNAQSQYPYYGLGEIAEEKGDVSSARVFYEKALAADSGFLLARGRLAGLPDAAPIRLHPPSELAASRAKDGPIKLRPRAPTQPTLRGSPAVAASYVPATPPLKPSLAAIVGQGSAEVQLGAWRSRTEAQAGWERILAQAADALEGATPLIVSADLPAGHYYRLRVSAGKQAPQAFCAVLAARGLDCFPIRK
ncbi:MAG: tetratricopeptide repeat protein [Rhizomicrobium sp.]